MASDVHQTTMRLPNDLRAALKAQAALECRTVNNLIIDLSVLGLRGREESNEDRLDQFKRLVKAAGRQ